MLNDEQSWSRNNNWGERVEFKDSKGFARRSVGNYIEVRRAPGTRMVSRWDVKYKSATDPWTFPSVGDCRTVSPQYGIQYCTVILYQAASGDSWHSASTLWVRIWLSAGSSEWLELASQG